MTRIQNRPQEKLTKGVASMAKEKQYISQGEEKGAIRISEEVLTSIALSAALEQDGIGGLGRRRGVRLLAAPEGVTVDLWLTVRFGCVILEVAKRVQKAVAEAIAAMTGLRVLAVNVQIVGVAGDEE